MIRRAALTALLALLICNSQAQSQANAPGDTPVFSAAGLYNLGNSFARAGKPGMAVLNYERARLLAPDDPDIEANLRFVRDSAHVPLEPVGTFEHLATLASPDVFSWLGLLGVLLAGVSLLAGRWQRRYRALGRIGVPVGLLLVASTLCNAAALWPTLHAAVVITPAAPVRVSPVPMGDSLFVLPEASIVHLAAEHEGFLLIRTPDGRTGWIDRANIVPVVPRAQPPAAPTGATKTP